MLPDKQHNLSLLPYQVYCNQVSRIFLVSW